MAAVFFYISGHGFGHSSRQIEIINALGRVSSEINVVVRTSAARWLFDRTIDVPFALLPGDVDTGVVQIDSLSLDERETLRRAGEFHAALVEKAGEEAETLRAHDARLVIADAPALGCAAAAAAGVPSFVCTNFTWDWIYADYPAAPTDAPDLVARIQEAYRKAQAAWRLPMYGGFETFTNVVDVPFVARHARLGRDDVRKRLGLPLQMPLALSSFGGYGVNDLDPASLDCLNDVGVVMTARGGGKKNGPPGLFFVDESKLYGDGPRYEDLVAAVDVVVTKPGYGIIAECVANDTAMLYTSRGRFAEYDVLVREMPRYLRSRFLEQESLLAGRWRDPLLALLQQPQPPERPATDGAEIVADMIRERVLSRPRLER